MNDILSFYEHRLSGEGTHRWIRLNILHLDTTNLPRNPYAPCATHAPTSHMVKLLLPDIDFYHYCPQRSCGKVMFLHLSVILFTGDGAPVHAGIYTPPLQADTPLGRHPLGQTPPDQYMLGYTPPPAQSMLGYTLPTQCIMGYTPPAQCMLG